MAIFWTCMCPAEKDDNGNKIHNPKYHNQELLDRVEKAISETPFKKIPKPARKK